MYVRVESELVGRAREAGVFPAMEELGRVDFSWEVSPARSYLALLEQGGQMQDLGPAKRFTLRWPFRTSDIFEPGGPNDGLAEESYTCLALFAWRTSLSPTRACETFAQLEAHGYLSWDGPENRYFSRRRIPLRMKGRSQRELIAFLLGHPPTPS